MDGNSPEVSEATRLQSPDLPKSDDVQQSINKSFKEEGIAAKVLERLHKNLPQNWPNLTSNVDDLNFGVKDRLAEPYDKAPTGRVRSIVVEFPNPDPQGAERQPRVEMFMGFGPLDPGLPSQDQPPVALSQHQLLTVDQAFKLQKEDREKAS